MSKQWIRTCQSCDYKLIQWAEPKDKSKTSYVYRKCPKCKSEDFDYGSWHGYDTKPWRDKWLALTGRSLTMPEDKLDAMLDELGEEGLFEGNDLYQALLAANQ